MNKSHERFFCVIGPSCRDAALLLLMRVCHTQGQWYQVLVLQCGLMRVMVSQILGNLTVCSTTCSTWHQTNRQRSALLMWKVIPCLDVFIGVFFAVYLNNQLTRQKTLDDVIKWKHFPHNWPFVRGIQWSPMNSPHKGQWCRALMF